MGSLLRYVDEVGKGCWARVTLENGDPIWISVAQTGVVVKKSRLGLFGAKLYEQKKIELVASQAFNLDDEIMEYSTPPEMTHPVLKVFTQVALESKTANHVAARMNQVFSN